MGNRDTPLLTAERRVFIISIYNISDTDREENPLETSTHGLVLAAAAAVDLQMHTIYSDGVWRPEQLLDYLVHAGFGLAAITDHDRVDTAAPLQALARQQGLPLLVAAEISASWHGEPTDVLCYGFEQRPGALAGVAQDIARRQQENTRQVCETLHKHGYASFEAQELAALFEQPSAQQPHELVALLKKRAPGAGMAAESAGQLLSAAGFAWATADLPVVVDAAHQSGAVCLLAHPGRGDGYLCFDTTLLDRLRAEVPIDGLEVYYPAHTPEQVALYQEYARKYSLLTSSGSDSHGPAKKPVKYRAALSRALLERLGIRVSESADAATRTL